MRNIVGCVCASSAVVVSSSLGATVQLTGMIEEVAPPPNAQMGQYESNTHARFWVEQQDVPITTPLTVDVIPFQNNPGGVYDSGQAPIEATWRGDLAPGRYNSFIYHADKDGPNVTFSGTMTFKDPVVGIIYKAPTLNDTDAIFGAPQTLYANGPSRGIELDGANNFFTISLSPDRRVISIQTVVAHNLDEMRILTVPSPGSAMLLGAVALVTVPRRRGRS